MAQEPAFLKSRCFLLAEEPHLEVTNLGVGSHAEPGCSTSGPLMFLAWAFHSLVHEMFTAGFLLILKWCHDFQMEWLSCVFPGRLVSIAPQ